MVRKVDRRVACAAVALVVLAGCGGSKHPSAASSDSAPARAAAPTTSASGLGEADFLAKTNAVCTTMDAKFEAIKDPSSAADLKTAVASIQQIITTFESYISQVDALVAQAPNRADLTEHWIKVEKAGFATARPNLLQFIAALQSGDQAAATAAGNALDKQPDDSPRLAAYLTTQKLTACAKLETDSEDTEGA